MKSLACLAAALAIGSAHAAISDPAAELQARFAQLHDSFAQNQFHRPVHMVSSEGSDRVMGEIYAVVAFPFATASAALDAPAEWCDVLILHLNTKYCRPSTDARAATLRVKIGKKYDQPIADAYNVDFTWRLVARTPNYLHVSLTADDGPLSTSDYRILLEVVPAEGARSYIRLTYSYSYGLMGRLAMQTYLATIGRNKVGFTVLGTDAQGGPRHIGGMRGLVERNTMRYYLAIESYLGSLSEPPEARLERSLRDWFAATESYARQLHEMGLGDYLAMKRKEYSRQQLQALS